jgi:uncharacterized membrane protein YfcA
MLWFLEIFGFSLFAGVIGSLVGIGGGILIVPFLTLVMGIEFHYAAGASIVSVIATSSGAGAAFLRDRLVNVRLGLFLNVSTVAGAVTGTLLVGHASPRVLGMILGVVLLYSAMTMLKAREPVVFHEAPQDSGKDFFRLNNSYLDPATNREVHYRVQRLTPATALLFVSGVLSGLLGIGSGALKVLVMDTLMRLPIKVSTTTSNFMIGLNAAASAGMFFARGDIQPAIAAPVALGVLAGAFLGSHLLRNMSGPLLRRVFFVVLLVSAFQMLWKAWKGVIT